VAILNPAVDLPHCDRGIGSVIHPGNAGDAIAGVRLAPFSLWPDDRGYFLEVLRVGHGLAAEFPPESTQVSATLTYAGVIKAFHYHLRQQDCWAVAKGMLQVALVDLRSESPTYGHRNTLYLGELRPAQLLIPAGVGHGYKVVSPEPAVLIYVTSRFYDPSDECRISYDDSRVNYAWETQYK
jgi:dTDP-4-dehydrorhamnose 3,5-epimerase